MLGMVVMIVIPLALARIDMHRNIDKRRQNMEQLVADFLGDVMTLMRGQFAIDGDVHLSALAVPHPADGNIVNRHDTFDIYDSMLDKMRRFRVNRVHDAEIHIAR